jgi:hypothetical protein
MQERRTSVRTNKLFQVRITSEELGDQWCVARNLSESGIFVEMRDPLPLRTKVLIRFQRPGNLPCICAMARIQNHYYFQYSERGELRALSGVGIRFLRFLPEAGDSAPREAMH